MSLSEQEMQALVREGEGIDAGAAAHAEAAASGNLDANGNALPPPDPVDLTAAKAAEWFIVPKTLAWAITAIFPELAPHYSDAKCMELATAIVPVAEKYGWEGVGDAPELGLLVGTAFFCMPAYQVHKARQAAKLEAKKKDPARAVGEPEPLKVINGSEAGA